MTTGHLPAGTDGARPLFRHFLAALAYRTQKAVRDAPDSFGQFSAGEQVRTPSELVRHMTTVLDFARSCFEGARRVTDPLPTLAAEIQRLHEVLADLSRHFQEKAEPRGITWEQLLQGPLCDAMTHAGQLALLRRLSGSPVPPESFVHARVDAANVGPDQPAPARPAASSTEAPR